MHNQNGLEDVLHSLHQYESILNDKLVDKIMISANEIINKKDFNYSEHAHDDWDYQGF
jgi:hypothetical protein